MENLIGKKFERLVVLKRMDSDRNRNSRWLCRCDCGKEKIIIGRNLKNGNTKSCGCLYREGNNTKHGHSTRTKMSKTYSTWQGMIQRCTNPNNKRYQDYGGRGIKVCQKWLKFINFLEDMGEPPSNKHQIDRIDNDGNYCKENCRWATSKEQNRNSRNNRLITYKGKTQCLIELAEEYQIPYTILLDRINRLGWSIEKALTTPTRRKNSYA